MVNPNEMHNFMHSFAENPAMFAENPGKLPAGMEIKVSDIKGIFGKSKIYSVTWGNRKIIEIKLLSHHRVRRLLRRSCRESKVVKHNLVAYTTSKE